MSTTKTDIAWTDRTWNPVRGCTRVSPGCERCYAEGIAYRFSGPGKPFEGLARKVNGHPQWTGVVRTVESALLEPLSWRPITEPCEPCLGSGSDPTGADHIACGWCRGKGTVTRGLRVFVNSMSDLFHEDVPDEFIDKVFAVMASSRHTFQILTKRPERMRAYIEGFVDARGNHASRRLGCELRWPLPNVWLGVSVENQKYADERIPLLLQTPAVVRFISAEPLLGPIRFADVPGFNKAGSAGVEMLRRFWVIVGGESGAKARPMDLAWARSIVQQCKAASVAVFVKQAGAFPLVPAGRQTHWDYRFVKRPEGEQFVEHDGEHWRMRLLDKKGGDIEELPEWARVREFPAVART